MYGRSSGRLARGAYGLRIKGLPPADGLLGLARAHWPAVSIALELGEPLEDGQSWFTDEESYAVLPAARTVWMSRTQRRAVVTAPQPPPLDDLVHPGLSPVAACFAAWAGYEVFHGSAVVIDGRAWALLGDKEAGKSSSAGWLHRRGYPVVADDMVVVGGGRVFAGPRCVDLRSEAARLLGGRRLGGERRDKWRLDLPPTAPDYPLGGWVVLSWDDRAELRSLPIRARLEALASNRVWRRLPPCPSQLLDIAARPAWELRRPRSWSSLEASVSLLLEAVRAERSTRR